MNEVFTNEPCLIVFAALSAFLFIIVMFLFICRNSSNDNREEFVNDSIFTAKLNKEVNAKYSKFFNIEKDEFSDYTWVKPNDASEYRNQNDIYCYFSSKDGREVSNFRFVYQYYAENWLFIRYMIFNIDGENITIIPDMKTDYGTDRYGCNIWEWCDQSVDNNGISGINEDFIKKIANATSVKIKMVGNKYYKIRTLNFVQIKSIKNTYEYYLALGGRFEQDFVEYIFFQIAIP